MQSRLYSIRVRVCFVAHGRDCMAILVQRMDPSSPFCRCAVDRAYGSAVGALMYLIDPVRHEHIPLFRIDASSLYFPQMKKTAMKADYTRKNRF